MVKQTLIHLNPDKRHYCPLIISMNRSNGSCNTAEDPFCRICVPNEIEDVNQKISNMIKGIKDTNE